MATRSDREAEAAADLVATLRSTIPAAALSVMPSRTSPDSGRVDVVMKVPQGKTWDLEVKSLARADPSRVGAMVAKRPSTRSEALPVLVADEIPEASRKLLKTAGWGYLDRRGHLRITDLPSTMIIDVDVEPLESSTPRPRHPIRGASGISYAAALLMTPDAPPTIREVARRARLSVSTVSDAARAIRDASFIDRDGRPLIPDLFWALAEAWHPERIPLLGKPIAGEAVTTDALTVLGDPTQPGWAVTGDLAAVAYDAPLAVAAGSPPDFYVPDRLTSTNAIRTYRPAPDLSSASCTVAVAPTLLACAPRFEGNGQRGALVDFFLTHPLFVALDLAADKARGVEILAGWNPRGFTRVW